jgi:hypothetical protein
LNNKLNSPNKAISKLGVSKLKDTRSLWAASRQSKTIDSNYIPTKTFDTQKAAVEVKSPTDTTELKGENERLKNLLDRLRAEMKQ